MRIEAKFIAILDRATCIPVISYRIYEPTEREEAMFARSGFGDIPGDSYTFHYLPNDDWCSYNLGRNPHDYTIGTALRHINGHWDELESGSAVDSEYIRGESEEPRTWEGEYEEGATERNLKQLLDMSDAIIVS